LLYTPLNNTPLTGKELQIVAELLAEDSPNLEQEAVEKWSRNAGYNKTHEFLAAILGT